MATSSSSGGLDLESILNSVRQATDQIVKGAGILQMNAADSQALNVNSAEVNKQAVRDSELVSTATNAAILKEQAVKQKVGLTFGTDISQSNEIYTALSGEMQKYYGEQQKYAAEIEKKQSVSFFENPLEAIINSFTINADIAKHNLAEARGDAAASQIQKLNQLSSQAAQLQGQFSAPVTQASAEAAARLTSAKFKIEANNQTIQGIANNSVGIKEALNLNAQQLQYLFQAKGAQNSEEQLQLSRAAAARSAREEARSAKMFELNFKAKEDEDKYYSSIVESINIGRAARGVPLLQGIQAEKVLGMLKSKQQLGQDLQDDLNTGERAYESGKITLANSPAEFAKRLATGQVVNLPEPQRYIVPLMGQVKDRVSTPGYKSKDGKSWDSTGKDVAGNIAIFNEAMQAAVAKEAAEVRAGDTKNLFALPGLQAFAGMRNVQQTPVFEKLFRERIKNGETFDDPTKVLQVTAEAVRKNQISYNEALSLATVYQQAQAVNLAEKNLNKFGIQGVTPAAVGYKVQIDLDKLKLGGSKVVDLTKPDELGRALNSYLAQISYQEGVTGRRKVLGDALNSVPLQFGPNITNVPPDGAPSIYR